MMDYMTAGSIVQYMADNCVNDTIRLIMFLIFFISIFSLSFEFNLVFTLSILD